MTERVPKEIINEYISSVKELNVLYNEMNDIYSSVDTIKVRQKKYLDKEKELNENLNGVYLKYAFIDQFGNHSIEERKVEDGKWEKYKDYLKSISIK